MLTLGAALACGCSGREGGDAVGSGGAGATGGGSGGSGGHGAAGSGGAACQPRSPGGTPTLWVSPAGTAAASGTESDPLDLATVLSASGPAQPGDVVLLKGGTYVGRFVSKVSGGPGAPVVFLAEPGARVTLDSNAPGGGDSLTIEGAWTEFVGLELTSSDPKRETQTTGSDPPDILRGGGATIIAPNVKLINCVIHDTRQGVSFWTAAEDAELYGNLIYNNGWNAPDRGHGHAIYAQNDQGTKRIVGNVMFFGFSFGIHAYTEGGSIQGFDIVDNVWFQSGASVPGDDGLKDGCLVGGKQPAARVLLSNNASWARGPGERGVALGYDSGVTNDDVVLDGNTLVGALAFNAPWKSIAMNGNSVYGNVVGTDPNQHPGNQFSTTAPVKNESLLIPNDYDGSRAHLIAYDWEGSGSVNVDLGAVVEVGANYTVYSVYDPWGEPVVSGVYDGGSVAVPLGTKPPPQPVGLDGAIVPMDDPGAAFGVFVVQYTPCQ